MDMRSGLDGLKSLLGVPQTATPGISPGKQATAASSTAAGIDRATLSQAASEAAQTSTGEDVRAEKVAAIQTALASGTYSVSPTAVASRMIDAMLTSH